MLVEMKRHNFDTLDDVALVWACIEPTLRQIRGKSFMAKSEVSAHLNTGQRALLMFQVFYGHSGNGTIEFLSHLSYLLSQKGVWSELKNGMRYFGINDIVYLLDEMEEVYDTLIKKSGKEDRVWIDLYDWDVGLELQTTIRELDKRMKDMMVEAVKLVATYIRNHSGEFMEIGD